MDDLVSLIANVQKFVKHCREKNKDLLKYNQFNETEDLRLLKIYSGEYAFEKSFDNAYSEVDNFADEQKLDFSRHKSYATEHVANGMHMTGVSGGEHRDVVSTESDDYVKERLIEFKKNDSNSMGVVVLPNIQKYSSSKEDNVLSEEKTNDVEIIKHRILRNETPRDNIVMDQLLEDDLELLKMYNNLKRDSTKFEMMKERKTKKRIKKSNTSVNIKEKDPLDIIKKKKLNSKMSLKETIRKNSKISTKGKSKKKKKKEDTEGEVISYLSSLENRMSKLHSKKSAFSTISEISVNKLSLSHMPMKRFSEKFVCFQEGIKGRLKNNFNDTSYNIGGMYMESEQNESESESERNMLGKLKNSKSMNKKRLKSSKDIKYSFGSGAYLSDYKHMINDLEVKNKISHKKKHKGNDVFIIINSLLHDFVPKLIRRYEVCIENLDKQNKVLKQKIKESLDFGDVQYDEIRELKCQLVQENNKNRKLTDTVNMLKEKFYYVNELESKNVEYLDEIVILRNKINFLEKVIEDNDHSKQNHELKRIRHSVKMLYNNLKNEMKLVNIMKVKYSKYKRQKKFSVYKWMHIIHKENTDTELKIESVKESLSTHWNNGLIKDYPSLCNLENNIIDETDLKEDVKTTKEEMSIEETQEEMSIEATQDEISIEAKKKR